MKKTALLLGFAMLTALVSAQVKQNDKGLYIDSDGALFTGILENKENGAKISELEIKSGQPNGEAKYYYASGKLMETGVYDAGQKDGQWFRYNEAGVNVGLAVYSMGKKTGTWLVWDDTGKKRFEMHYVQGEKTGTWYNWDANGEMVSSKDYNHTN